jgi:hypothetical protein
MELIDNFFHSPQAAVIKHSSKNASPITERKISSIQRGPPPPLS